MLANNERLGKAGERLKEARICVGEACRKKPEDFRMWDNNAQICLALDDVRETPPSHVFESLRSQPTAGQQGSLRFAWP